ncbi:hypothetical protein FRC08_003127 [Ceratobasidium sp. 394]|nr:hypothetical protein FRC08_003127 [Ceratobasidium sp. 394]
MGPRTRLYRGTFRRAKMTRFIHLGLSALVMKINGDRVHDYDFMSSSPALVAVPTGGSVLNFRRVFRLHHGRGWYKNEF